MKYYTTALVIALLGAVIPTFLGGCAAAIPAAAALLPAATAGGGLHVTIKGVDNSINCCCQGTGQSWARSAVSAIESHYHATPTPAPISK